VRPLVAEKLGEVVAGVHECPLALHGRKTPTAELSPSAVLLVVSEERFDGMGAFGVGLGPLGCAQTMFRGLEGAGVDQWRPGGRAP